MIKKNLKPIIFIFLCTLFTTAGQIFWKIGSKNIDNLNQAVLNLPIFLGFVCYGLGSMIFIIALKYGDLSLIYPFMSLSFVWVNLASIIYFKESINLISWLGIACIIIGLSFIGGGSSK